MAGSDEVTDVQLNGRAIRVFELGPPTQAEVRNPVVSMGRVSWLVSEPATCVRDNTELDDEFAAVFAEYCAEAGTSDVPMAADHADEFCVSVRTDE